MNERDFDKLISKKLKEEGSYSNIETNWQKVKDKMAQLQTSESSMLSIIVPPIVNTNYTRVNKRLLSFLLSFAALLVGSNIWFAWRLYYYTPIVQSELTSTMTYPQHDTIVLTKVIYRVDTIYKKVADYNYSPVQPHAVDDSMIQTKYLRCGHN